MTQPPEFKGSRRVNVGLPDDKKVVTIPRWDVKKQTPRRILYFFREDTFPMADKDLVPNSGALQLTR